MGDEWGELVEWVIGRWEVLTTLTGLLGLGVYGLIWWLWEEGL